MGVSTPTCCVTWPFIHWQAQTSQAAQTTQVRTGGSLVAKAQHLETAGFLLLVQPQDQGPRAPGDAWLH